MRVPRDRLAAMPVPAQLNSWISVLTDEIASRSTFAIISHPDGGKAL